MDSVQMQIAALDRKLDGLYDSIEQLDLKVSSAIGEGGATANSYPVEARSLPDGRAAAVLFDPNPSRSAMVHKDIIADDDRLEGDRSQKEKELTPELQIQRLTAQLTAAYNRIAALEEQLLSRRVH